ncbi:MAG: hypothetical protein IT440_13465 [Phycisphaeraceae bacterium]|nr:hypothetical protein [Phycisphaeraceae bacterium]
MIDDLCCPVCGGNVDADGKPIGRSTEAVDPDDVKYIGGVTFREIVGDVNDTADLPS